MKLVPTASMTSPIDDDIVLALGTAGGSVTIRRDQDSSGDWYFTTDKDESTLCDMLSEEDKDLAIHARTREYSRSLQQALEQLDKYLWTRFYPTRIHPEYREAILLAVAERADARDAARWRRQCNREGPWWFGN